MFCDAKLLHINFRMGIEESLMSLWVTLSRSIGIWVSSVEISRRWKGNTILSEYFRSIRITDLEVPNPTLGVMFFGCHLFYPALLMIPVRTFKRFLKYPNKYRSVRFDEIHSDHYSRLNV